jgi:hypothetical protein
MYLAVCLRDLGGSIPVLDIVELELAWHSDGDFGWREVARVRDVHLLIVHTKFHADSVVVTENPY